MGKDGEGKGGEEQWQYERGTCPALLSGKESPPQGVLSMAVHMRLTESLTWAMKSVSTEGVLCLTQVCRG